MEKAREDTIRNVRACLVSVKGAIQLHSFQKDYQQLMGENIPYKKFGFNSLEDFLRSEPTLTLSKRDGTTWIDAKASKQSSHITQMVSNQRPPKKKRVSFRRSQSQRNGTRFNSCNQIPMKKWNHANQRKVKFENSPRPAAVNHRQFVNPGLPPRLQVSPPKMQVSPPKPTRSNNVVPTPPVNPPRKAISKMIVKTVGNNNVPKVQDATAKEYEGFTRNRESLIAGINKSNSAMTPEEYESMALSRINFSDPQWNWSSSDESGFEDKTFVITGDLAKDIYAFTKFHNIDEPVYKFTTGHPQKKKKLYYLCQLNVGDQSWVSFPDLSPTEEAAREICDKKAWEELLSKYGLKKREPIRFSSDKDILERVPLLIQKHYNGVWSNQVAEDYRDQYHEQLSPHWISLIRTYPYMTVEEISGKHVLRYCLHDNVWGLPNANFSGTNLKPLQKFNPATFPEAYDISIPTSTVMFNDDGVLCATVTCGISAQEIWCRQLETKYEAEFEKNLEDMETFYNTNYLNQNASLSAKTFTKGGYYAAWIEDTWFRVRVLNVYEEFKEVDCFLVDRGDDLLVKMKNIYILLREFAKVPEQAFLVRLFGIEDLYDISVGSEHVQKLEGRVFSVELINPVEDDKTAVIGVVMYDLESQKVVNMDLLNKLCIENALPELHDEVPNDVNITNIESNGDIYVQVLSYGKDKLMSLIQEMEPQMETIVKIEGKITKEGNCDRLFLYFDEVEKCLKRIKIIDWEPKGIYAQIYFIDYGNTKVIMLSSATLYPLDEVDTVINSFPEQAVLVKLDNLHQLNLANFEEKIKHLLKDNQGTLIKVTKRDEDNVPLVKIFVRSSTGLFSINKSFEKLQSPDRTQNNEVDKLSRLKIEDRNVPSTGILKAPPIPLKGSYFEVTVPVATNPWNFVVQPRVSNAKLIKLGKEMQSFYSNSDNSPLNLEEIIPGQIYASKWNHLWSRTCVIKIVNRNSISVYYCDYGHYASVAVGSLVAIKEQFLELPYQSIKAKFADILPKHGKWSINDCDAFKELVCNKEFVSIVCSIEADELYKSDKVLRLKLIDTSKSEDVFIEQILFEKKIAIPLKVPKEY